MKKFSDFNLKDSTNYFIQLNNFKQPTRIQGEIIPVALKGKDIIGLSKTGSGKTHSYLIPILEKIDFKKDEVQAVIIAPTRELAMQIFDFAKLMTKVDNTLKIKLVVGGKNKVKEISEFSGQPQIVVGTPGRLKDLFLNENLLRLDSSKVVVLDEADMIIEYGYLEDVDAIVSHLDDKVQLMAFSATMSKDLKVFLKKYMNETIIVDLNDSKDLNPNIRHILIPTKHKPYKEKLIDLLKTFKPYTCLIFGNSREEVDEIGDYLRKNDFDIVLLHGGLTSRQRKQALKDIETEKHSYIVASDIAARGLDIKGVSHVISCGFPNNLEFYIHRAGRTGRNDDTGTCYALYNENEDKSIRTLIDNGVNFEHYSVNASGLKKLKPYGYKYKKKTDKAKEEVLKKLTKKDKKVKPNYKKKIQKAIDNQRRKDRREFINNEIKKQAKEKNRKKQIEKNMSMKQK